MDPGPDMPPTGGHVLPERGQVRIGGFRGHPLQIGPEHRPPLGRWELEAPCPSRLPGAYRELPPQRDDAIHGGRIKARVPRLFALAILRHPRGERGYQGQGQGEGRGLHGAADVEKARHGGSAEQDSPERQYTLAGLNRADIVTTALTALGEEDAIQAAVQLARA